VTVALWETAELPLEPTYTSPSGKTEIRMLPNLPSGEITHATIRARETSSPAYLDSLHEFFFVLAGSGQLWRCAGAMAELVELRPLRCVSIPPEVNFQYRSDDDPMIFLVVVAPRWSADHWHAAPAGLCDPVSGKVQTAVPAATGRGWSTIDLPEAPDHRGPDGSESRELLDCADGGVAHLRLPANSTTPPVVHRTVDQVWFVLEGEGEIWRRRDDTHEAVRVRAGTCLTIPVGTSWQCRNLGSTPLEMLVGTFPRWPGPGEAVEADGPWKAAHLFA
jgi:mannose-6-phosphate isomerase-like protein (cupin superfamily)